MIVLVKALIRTMTTIKLCDIKELFGIFLESDKHQNVMGLISSPIVIMLKAMYTICADESTLCVPVHNTCRHLYNNNSLHLATLGHTPTPGHNNTWRNWYSLANTPQVYFLQYNISVTYWILLHIWHDR